MASANESFLYVYASEIVREYEAAALKAGVQLQNRDVMMVQWKGPIQAIKMTLSSASSALSVDTSEDKGESPTEKEDSSESSSYKQDSQVKQDAWWGQAEWRGFSIFGQGPEGEEGFDACKEAAKDWAEDFLDPNATATDQPPGLQFGGASVQASYDPMVDVVKFLEDLGLNIPKQILEDPGGYAERCFNCMTSLDFNWQVQPINFMSEFDKLLRQMEDLLDWMARRANPQSVFQWLCNFDWLFTALCPTSWVGLLGMLSALLIKYQMDSFSLSLDWTSIVGPIIKGIMDAIVSLIEALIALVLQPIDCVIGVLRTIDNVVDSGMEALNQVYGFGDYLLSTRNPVGGLGKQIHDKASGKKSYPWEGKGSENEVDRVLPGIEGGSPYKVTSKPESNMLEPATEVWGDLLPDWQPLGMSNKPDSSQKVSSVVTGITIAGNSTLTEETQKGIFENPNFNGLNGAILGLQELKQWITELGDNLITGLRSLSKMFGGRLNLSVQKSGLIMFVLDLIALVKAIMKIKSEGCSEGNSDDNMLNMASGLKAEDLLEITPQEVASIAALEKTLLGKEGFKLESSDGVWQTNIEIDRCSSVVPEDAQRVFRDIKDMQA